MQESINLPYKNGIDKSISESVTKLSQRGYKVINTSYRIRGEDSYAWRSVDNVSLEETLSVLNDRDFRGYHIEDHPPLPTGFFHYEHPFARITMKKESDEIEFIIKRMATLLQRVTNVFRFGRGRKRNPDSLDAFA